MSRATVVLELESNSQSSRDLSAGGVYVPDCGLRLAEECDLVVCGATERLVLPARVVYVDARRGAGLELVGFSLEVKARIAALEPFAPPEPVPAGAPELEESDPDRSPLDDAALDRPPSPEDDLGYGRFHESAPMIDLKALDDDLAIPHAGDEATTLTGDDPDADRAALSAGNTDAFDTLEPDDMLGGDGGPRDHARGSRPIARTVHERLRGLNLAAQLKMATSGELHERIILERLYGKNVWETLLRNPRLSPTEVSRIARYGSLPRVLLEIIVGNNAWLQVAEVRRALLSNPRLATDQIMKVLRLMPKHELKLAAIQSVYPHAVRNVAKLLLRGE
ncbi:MAG TPA: hypothetical protein VGD80_07300 [Kofleriaceae bacterium]